jgi:hypothetical protein
MGAWESPGIEGIVAAKVMHGVTGAQEVRKNERF